MINGYTGKKYNGEIYEYKRIFHDGSFEVVKDIKYNPEDPWGCAAHELIRVITPKKEKRKKK